MYVLLSICKVSFYACNTKLSNTGPVAAPPSGRGPQRRPDSRFLLAFPAEERNSRWAPTRDHRRGTENTQPSEHFITRYNTS